MENAVAKQGSKTIKDVLSQSNVKERFSDLLGRNPSGFLTTVINTVSNSDHLKNATPESVLFAAATAASMDLQVDPNIGFAYIVPYKKHGGPQQAQFQIGYKGIRQLALRTGQFKYINEGDVREGEIKSRDRLTGEAVFDWIQDDNERLKKKVIGYFSYFELMSDNPKIKGYSHYLYMTVEQLEAHGKKFSQSFKKGFGLWKDDFHSMAIKTVSKLNLSKNAPLSTEMQRAFTSDQGVINDWDGSKVEYPDNETVDLDHEEVSEQKEDMRILDFISNAESVADLNKVMDKVKTPEQRDAWDARLLEIKGKAA